MADKQRNEIHHNDNPLNNYLIPLSRPCHVNQKHPPTNRASN